MKKQKIVSIFSILLLILAFCYVPVKEAYTLKEDSLFESVGNCRIVNTVESINNNLKLKIYYYNNVAKNGTQIRHVIAVDSNNKIVDKSDLRPDENGVILESLDGKDLKLFEDGTIPKRFNNKIIKPTLEFIYSKENGVDIINMTLDTYYFIGYIKVFSFAYKFFH